jgi:HAD superfamily hydrolase (TIGR01549 family)
VTPRGFAPIFPRHCRVDDWSSLLTGSPGVQPAPLGDFAQRRVEAVTFDYWDTLVCVRSSGTRHARRTALRAVLDAAAPGVDDRSLDTALDVAVARHSEHWHANVQFTPEDGALALLDSLGLTEPDAGISPAVRHRLVTAFVRAATDLRPELTPSVAEVLGQLRDAGVRMGIVCDVGMTASDILRDYLDHAGVLELFDHWSFSDEVGVYKPDPRIFAHALDGLGGVDPQRAVHVGDLRRTDVAGARAAGMATVRYRGRNDDGAAVPEGGPEAATGGVWADADAVVDDHSQLPGLLGIS